MNLTKVQLDKVSELAQLTITPQMIAACIEVDELEFVEACNTPGTPERSAFLSGVAQQMLDTRAAIIKAAHNGSNPAQTELLGFIDKQLYHLRR